jgi:tRNA threonylcarbamoyladenosine biosynthesis protein TsaB
MIPVDTLQLLAYQAALEMPEAALFVPMIDARRMEVFVGSFDAKLHSTSVAQAFIVKEDFFEHYPAHQAVFAGNGSAKLRFLANLPENTCILSELIPLANFMGPLAYEKWQLKSFVENYAFQPRYLKSFGEKAINDIN